MPSSRQALGIFLAVAVAVVLSVVVFVYPGLPAGPCVANVEPSTSPGHWFCSIIVIPSAPSASSAPSCGKWGMVNGTPIVTNFRGYLFSVHLFGYCVGPSNLGLNASVIKPSGGVFNITISRGAAFWEDWHNWTSPENDTGFQWQPNFSVPFQYGWNVSLLIAPR